MDYWTEIGTANKGKKILWEGLDRRKQLIYAVTNPGQSPEGVGGYRSLDSLLKIRGLTKD